MEVRKASSPLPPVLTDSTTTSMSSNQTSSTILSSDSTLNNQINEVHTPQTPSEWWLYLRAKQEKSSSKASDMIKYYTSAMQNIPYERYGNDEYLVRIWLEFIKLQMYEPETTFNFSVYSKASPQIVRKFFDKMKLLAIGIKSALFYVEWANFEISHRNYDQAHDILQSGLEHNACPTELIHNRLKSMPNKLQEYQKHITAPSSNPILPTTQLKTNPAQKNNPNELMAICTETIVEPLPNEEHAKEISLLEPSENIENNRKDETIQKQVSKRSALIVNGQAYVKLELLGKGGSSKVYKVLSPGGKILAIKRVTIKGVDPVTLSGYINEIELLKRMADHDRIIQLYDSEINKKGGYIHMVMECGEIDLANVLHTQGSARMPVDLNFMRVYWQQMLEAVHSIHEQRVVHTDLKPANFLFVRGGLKLIDFGIAKAIQNDTTNIHRDHHVGTVNYMSPEAILDTNTAKDSRPSGQPRAQCMKLGRPSDVWSLGCILYQMVYGRTPFSHLTMIQKLHKIVDPDYAIDYPNLDTTVSNPFIIPLLKSCLKRDPKARITIPQLLEHPFIKPDAVTQSLYARVHELETRLQSAVQSALKLRKENPTMDDQEIIRQSIK